jgi:hypothetical protein
MTTAYRRLPAYVRLELRKLFHKAHNNIFESKCNFLVVNVTFSTLTVIFPCFIFFIFIQSANVHKHAYISAYVYYSDDFEFGLRRTFRNGTCLAWERLYVTKCDMRWMAKKAAGVTDEYNDDDNHVDGVRLRLWTAATSGLIVHPEWYVSMGTMVEWCRHRKIPDSSTRAPWQNLPAKSTGSKQEERAKGMMNLALRSIFL